jgi:hypothetical protein
MARLQQRLRDKAAAARIAVQEAQDEAFAQQIALEQGGLSAEECFYLMKVFSDLLAPAEVGAGRENTTIVVSELRLPVWRLGEYASLSHAFTTESEFLTVDWVRCVLNERKEDVSRIMNPQHKFLFHRHTLRRTFARLFGQAADKVHVTHETLLDFKQVVKVMCNAHVGLSGTGISRAWFPFDPDSQPKQLWDGVVMTLLLYTSFSVPYTLAFGDETYDYLFGAEGVAKKYAAYTDTPWAYFDLCLDIIFCADIMVTFCTAYVDRGNYVQRFRRIARNYLKTWFIVDLLGSVPFDKILAAAARGNPHMARFLEGLRLIRLLKTVRAARLMQRVNQMALKDTTGAFKTAAAVFRAIFAIIFISHFLACVFYMLLEEGAPGHRSWLSAVDPLLLDKVCAQGLGEALSERPVVLNSDPLTLPVLFDSAVLTFCLFGQARTPPHERYVLALYWAVMTISTIGYGDLVPVTHAEREMVVVVSCLGCIFFSYAVAQITTVVTDNFGRKEIDLSTRLSRLQSYLDFRVADSDAKRKVMSYFSHSYRKTGKLFDESGLAGDLPRPLRERLLQVIGREQLEKVPFMAGMPDACTGDLYMRLSHYTYDRDDGTSCSRRARG